MNDWHERADKLLQKRLAQGRPLPAQAVPLHERLRKSLREREEARTPFRELPTFIRGRAAEQLVSRWLQGQGWYVIPSYDYAGEDGDKPPRLQGIREGLAVPDLDVAKDGIRRWVEVKAKEKANWRYTTRIYEHGIDLRLLREYQEVLKITGTDVWIAIYEENSGELRASSISALGEPRIGTNPADGKQMANWDREKFRLLHTFHLGPVRNQGDGNR